MAPTAGADGTDVIDLPQARRARLAAIVLVGALAACADGTPPGDASGQPPATAEVPPDAVQVGPELYQVPIGPDADGCMMYRLYSPTRMVAQVISYRTDDGGFTIDRTEALCEPDG